MKVQRWMRGNRLMATDSHTINAGAKILSWRKDWEYNLRHGPPAKSTSGAAGPNWVHPASTIRSLPHRLRIFDHHRAFDLDAKGAVFGDFVARLAIGFVVDEDFER